MGWRERGREDCLGMLGEQFSTRCYDSAPSTPIYITSVSAHHVLLFNFSLAPRKNSSWHFYLSKCTEVHKPCSFPEYNTNIFCENMARVWTCLLFAG
jgi:hypothetical protein